MNDQTKRPLNVAPFYWYHVTSVDGIWDQEIRAESHELPHRHGAVTGDFYYTGKTIVIAGVVVAKDLTLLRQAQRAMEMAFWDLLPHPLTFTLWGESQVSIVCRKNQRIDMPEQQLDGGPAFKRPFTVQLYADDPRMYVAGSTTVYPAWSV